MILGALANIEFHLWGNSQAVPQVFRRAQLLNKNVIYGKRIFIGKDLYIRHNGNLILGERCSVGSNARIYNHGRIVIGCDFISAAGLSINTGGHNVVTLEPYTKDIVIGNRVWCGMNVTILAGVTIGDDVVIAAGAVVTKSIPSNSVVAGIPAKIIRQIDRHEAKLWAPDWY